MRVEAHDLPALPLRDARTLRPGELVIAVGHPGKVEDLIERDRVREVKSMRRPVSESVFEGRFA